MIFGPEFLEETIKACRREQERLRLDYERQEGVIRFCEKVLKDASNPSKDVPPEVKL